MNHRDHRISTLRLALPCAAFLCLRAMDSSAVPNNWTNTDGGLWRVATNWSEATVPNSSSNFDPTQITNANTKTVTIDAATTAANLSLRALTLSAPAGSTNTLQLMDLPTPLSTSRALLVGNRGVLEITNSSVSAQSTFDIVNGALTLHSGSLDCAANCDLQSGNIVVNGGTVNATVGATGIRMGRSAGAEANLTLNGGTVNTLRITLGSVSGSHSSLTLAGGNLICTDSFSAAQLPSTTGNVTMTGGNLIVTNGITKIADRATATFTQSGGNSAFAYLSVGDVGVGTFNLSGGQLTVTPRTTNDFAIVGNLENGTFNQSGGAAIIKSELHVADFSGVVGTLFLTGGQFFATNDLVGIGRYGLGNMTVSNALVVLTNTSVGRHDTGIGTLTIQSNANVFLVADLSIGRLFGASGQVFVEGGLLAVTNDDLWVGRGGSGELTVSGGTVHAKSLRVGESDDGTNAPVGNFTLSGGNVIVSSNFTVGTPLLSTGHVAIASGTLDVTNAAGTAFLAVRAGEFTMNGGTLKADSLFITNANGSFTFNNGTIQCQTLNVANGKPFVVGDGANAATLELQGGTYTFADGLVISPNGTVTGCGTIIGTISNSGTLNTNCSASATVTLGNLNQVYDGSAKSVTASTTPPGLAVSLTYDGSANAPTNAGSYQVIGTVVDTNYSGSATNTLVISKASATVTLGNLNQVYDGTAKSVTASTTPAGLAVSLTYDGSANAPTNAGSYQVIGTVVDVNYLGSATNTLVIATAPSGTVTITDVTKAGTTTALHFSTVSNASHTLEFNTNLATSNWMAIPPVIIGSGGVMSATDTSATNDSRFYRVRFQ